MNEPVKNELPLFEDQKIRVAWDAEREEWAHQRLLAIRIRNELTDVWLGTRKKKTAAAMIATATVKITISLISSA